MSFPITRPGKNQLILSNPVIAGAGVFGYGSNYRDMVNYEKLGAFITNPVTYTPRQPTRGTRYIPHDSGVLVHTGLPNTGLSKVIKRWGGLWQALPIPTILHLVATEPDEIRKSMVIIDNTEMIAAVELGLNDDIDPDYAVELVEAAVRNSEKPILVRLPLADAYTLAEPIADTQAAALMVSAPPRGTARDPISGKLIGGRVYSPVLKPIVLRLVGNLKRRIHDIPIIGAGGIHSAQDARDYLEAGAVAVQVDSVVWVLPRMIELIARDLGGLVLTRPIDALADEWFTGIGDTVKRDQELRRGDFLD